MRLFSSLLLFVLFSVTLGAQSNWSEHIAPILYENCTSCHHSEGIGPFSLVGYDNASGAGTAMVDAVYQGIMPPWTADTSYQRYSHERILTEEEKQAIYAWSANDFASGDLSLAPPAPVYNDLGFIAAEPDLELIMDPYTSSATSMYDDYVCISLPTALTEDKKIRAFEVIPGNSSIVHHCLVYIDAEGNYGSDFSGFCGGPTEGLIGGYTPGTGPTVFPSNGEDFNMGINLPAGSDIVFAMHYPAGSAGEIDQTRVRFYFYDDATPIRPVFTAPILANWNLYLPANEVTEVETQFDDVQLDISVLTVFPHMHLIGESIEAFAVTEENDSIPFVRIPHWDFDWQEFLLFRNMVHVPQGSTLYGKAVYRNTADHPHNPNDPPIDVYAGLNTTDEMFLVYFHFTSYFPGDELIDLAEYSTLPTSLLELPDATTANVTTGPNPASEKVWWEVELENAENVSLYIYDQQGRLVDRVADKQMLSAGTNRLEWDAQQLARGTYLYSMTIDGKSQSGKLILR